jgi:hypothetical protein
MANISSRKEKGKKNTEDEIKKRGTIMVTVGEVDNSSPNGQRCERNDRGTRPVM